jgi:2-C-methyl-D-erythritol 4-phosphate cytidylyltransferase/2-C-methyl-D-erythritol 2,4-cyclodiphosphate synthase
LLGAAGQGDIGEHFPPTDPQWRGANSGRFIEHALELAVESGFEVGNVDLTIICEAPRIGPYKAAMRARLAALLQVGPEAVNVKATTTERLGFTGRSEGIAAQAVCTLLPIKRTA